MAGPCGPVEGMPASRTALGTGSETFNEAWDRGIEALLAKRYTVALVAFREAGELNPEDPKVRANLKRLHDMGIEEPPAD